MAFEPGQYALAWLPGVEGPRAYSMSNAAMSNAMSNAMSDADGGTRWEFHVRKLPQGQGSEALFAMQPGQRIHIDGPYGMAWLKRDAPRDILCLAGGSGLAPMLSIARAAMHEPRLMSRQLHFIYGGRTPADVCGEDMLRVLPGFGTRLHYRAFVSTPQPQGGKHEVAFVHEAAQRLHGDALASMEVYFAGPPVMATAVQAMLLQAGVPPEQQHFDSFY
jgi:toluene monooxygenase electron transfer component